MKHFKNSLLIALFAIFGTSCSNTEEVEMLVDNTPTESVMKSRSVGIDYSSLELLPNRTIMPREGQVYYGTITYRDQPFSTAIYWNFEIPDYNLFATIGGEHTDLAGTHHLLMHFATYNYASSQDELSFVIKCIYEQSGFVFIPGRRYVTFFLRYRPSTQECYCEVWEDTDQRWPLEVD